MNVTLDGYMSGPDCELDWHFRSWTDGMAETLCEELSKADTILLGHVTYSAMAKYWASKAIDPSFPREDIAFAEMMNIYTKVVFSKTLTMPEWNNSVVVKGNIPDEVGRLKNQPGKSIMLYGSGKVASALMKSGLVDELHLWVHPVLIGKGKRLFKGQKNIGNLKLNLLKTKTFGSGVIILYYDLSTYNCNLPAPVGYK